MQQELNALRLRLDFLAQVVQHKFAPSHPLDNCRWSIYLAKAWTGKLLGTLGGETPYKMDGKRESIADIEPTDSRATGIIVEEMNDVKRADWTRQQIAKEIEFLETIPAGAINTRAGSIARTQIEVHLTEARFHLGFELERIREVQ